MYPSGTPAPLLGLLKGWGRMISHLRQDHQRLRELMTEQEAINGGEMPEITRLLSLRALISLTFREHYQRECEALEALRTGNPRGRMDLSVSTYHRQFGPLYASYSQIVRNWHPKRIVAEWHLYCEVSQDIIRRYSAFLDWVERDIHPLIEENDPCSARSIQSGSADTESGSPKFDIQTRISPSATPLTAAAVRSATPSFAKRRLM